MKFADTPFEIKTLEKSGHIEGLAAAFGNVDMGGDRLLPGSLTKTLAKRGNAPLPMLLHHDQKRPIGAWKVWEERPEGLYLKGSLTLSTRDAQEAFALAKDGALTGLSIGWLAGRETYDRGVRVLPEIELFEASLVTIPMNEKARVTAVKSITGPRDIEEILHKSGLSNRKAKAAATAAWRAINRQDDEQAANEELTRLLQASAARIAAQGEIIR